MRAWPDGSGRLPVARRNGARIQDSASEAVRAEGPVPRAAMMARTTRRQCGSSPKSLTARTSISSVAVSSQRAAGTPALGSIRMSAGASVRNEKPRPDRRAGTTRGRNRRERRRSPPRSGVRLQPAEVRSINAKTCPRIRPTGPRLAGNGLRIPVERHDAARRRRPPRIARECPPPPNVQSRYRPAVDGRQGNPGPRRGGRACGRGSCSPERNQGAPVAWAQGPARASLTACRPRGAARGCHARAGQRGMTTPCSQASIQAGNVWETASEAALRRSAPVADACGCVSHVQIPRRRMMSPKFSPEVRASTFCHREGE
jgi:hypothetical protein